jgi:hypothetical protein
MQIYTTFNLSCSFALVILAGGVELLRTYTTDTRLISTRSYSKTAILILGTKLDDYKSLCDENTLIKVQYELAYDLSDWNIYIHIDWR